MSLKQTIKKYARAFIVPCEIKGVQFYRLYGQLIPGDRATLIYQTENRKRETEKWMAWGCDFETDQPYPHLDTR